MLLLTALGCNDKSESAATNLSEKESYNVAIAELSDAIGTVAAFRDYLKEPAQAPFAPQRRPDLLKSQFFAANTIRHAANYARQRGERSKSTVTKGLTDALAKLATACTEPGDASDVAKCEKQVAAFDQALQPIASKAKAAGADKPFPRVSQQYINATATKAAAAYRRAMGPGPKEQAYLDKRADTTASVDDLLAACDAAKAEVAASAQALDKSSEGIRELAVVHKYAVETQCNRFGGVIKAHQGLEACEKNKPASSECKSACGKVKRIIEQGLPAAAFSKVEADYKDTCHKN
ncbi:MAG TPA: hypothetical protein ENK23_04075 [Sorangium sp.]|nr:hypothetical protein [Sorangium sp.]